MKRVDISQFQYGTIAIFNDCISCFDDAKANRIISYSTQVDIASNEYPSFIPFDFDNLPKHSIAEEDKGLFSELYEDVFVDKKEQLNENYYAKLKELANGICPFCERQPPRTLDHFLPKKQFPLLAVTPQNLVPCCRDCNSNKLTYNPKNNSEVLYHPYYDNITVKWLKITLKFGKKDELSASASVLPLSDKILQSRLERTLVKFKLEDCYNCGIINDVLALRHRYWRAFKKSGTTGLKKQIIIDIDSAEKEDINSCKSAMFRALLDQIADLEKWLNLY